MYEDLIQLIERARVAFPKFGNGVGEATITAAEQTLGIPLPESYKWWLKNYGGGQLRGDIVYGLDEEGLERPDIVELARMNEKEGLYHKDHLVFCIGNTENFLFDTVNRENGEYQVLLHGIVEEPVPYADSFAEFLRKRIREVYKTSN